MATITNITATSHVKRAHPFERGHYDASITLEVKLENDDEEDFFPIILGKTRKMVVAECDTWEMSVYNASPSSYSGEYHEALTILGNLLDDLDVEDFPSIDAARAFLEKQTKETDEIPF